MVVHPVFALYALLVVTSIAEALCVAVSTRLLGELLLLELLLVLELLWRIRNWMRHVKLVAALAELRVRKRVFVASMAERTVLSILLECLRVEAALHEFRRFVRSRHYVALHVARSTVALLVAWANACAVAVLVN